MSETSKNGQSEKSTRILRRPEATSVLTPTFAASRQTARPSSTAAPTPSGSLLQRRCGCGKHSSGGRPCRACQQAKEAQDEHEGGGPGLVQAKAIAGPKGDFCAVPARTSPGTVVQAQLTVGAPDDAYEQEADRVAEAVMNQPKPASELGQSSKPTISRVESAAPASGESGGAHGAADGAFSAPSHVETKINQMQAGGEPLAAEDQEFFEERMGYDFGHVRLHTDASAVQASRDIQAKAFTFGSHIAFNAGAYQPGTSAGRRLLAHELTHVVQQSSAAPLAARSVVQRGFVDDVVEMADRAMTAAGEIVEDIANWIDLLAPKRDLMNYMTDVSWIVEIVNRVDDASDANPKHSTMLTLELYGIGVRAGAEAMTYVLRIRNCNSLEEIDTLRDEFNEWKAERSATLEEELEAKVEEYREVERSWLQSFSESSETEDPVHPNQSNKSVALTLKGGVPQSQVIVETRVSYTWNRTAAALQDNDGDGNPDVPDWTDEEKAHFQSRFQQQLDDIWTTGAGATPPFRLTAPDDHLLADESPKWSDVTATMKAQVTNSDDSPHFKITVSKKASGERKRANVGHNGTFGTAQFYLDTADSGYRASSGPDANVRTGAQLTLAHEWYHMIDSPDEYAEHSAAQATDPAAPASAQARWGNCQQHFNDIINDPASTPEEIQQARDDLRAVQQPWTDVDRATPGFQAGIYQLSGRSDIPRDCFAIRGPWREGAPGHSVLQPGGRSRRGGTTISDSAEDAARLSDRGNQVRPYMREGIVEELQAMLQGRYDPEVSFDHNFQDFTTEENLEIAQVRIQNVLHDINDLGASRAPGGEPEAGDSHDHDH